MSQLGEPKFKNRKTTPKKEWTPIDFVNIRLTPTQVDDFKDWYAKENPAPLPLMDEVILGGYKISYSADTENACYIVTTTGTDSTPNAHLATSSRSDDLGEAIAIAYYKIAIMFKWDVWTVEVRRNNWG